VPIGQVVVDLDRRLVLEELAGVRSRFSDELENRDLTPHWGSDLDLLMS
jgi:hypothetical protein